MEQKSLVIRPQQVESSLGFSKNTRLGMENESSPQYDPTWPKPIKLSARSIGYIAAEVEAWVASRPRVRGPQAEE